MSIVQTLTSVALRPWAEAAWTDAGSTPAARLLADRLRSQAARLGPLLTASVQHAWMTLEIALVGPAFWDRLHMILALSDDVALVRESRGFLDHLTAEQLPAVRIEFRQRCVRELRRLLESGLLTRGDVTLDQLAEEATAAADPQYAEAEARVLSGLTGEMVHAGCPNLIELLTAKETTPILVVAARQFLRQAVAQDADLVRDLPPAGMGLQEPGWLSLLQLLTRQAALIEPLLSKARATLEKGFPRALDLVEEWRTQNPQAREVYQAVWELRCRLGCFGTVLNPREAFLIQSEFDRSLASSLIARCRTLLAPPDSQRPALLNAVAKIELALGDLSTAENDFLAVAGLTKDPNAQGKAHFNAYRTALEQKSWKPALKHLLQALRLGGKRLAPFPVGPLVPERLLGADAFGVVFSCKPKDTSERSHRACPRFGAGTRRRNRAE